MSTVAAALATWATTTAAQSGRKALASLVALVRKRFRTRAEARDVLEGVLAKPAEPSRAAALAELLQQETERDPDFARQVRLLWETARHEADTQAALANSVHGNVTGTVVQARDVHGGIVIGRE